MTILAYCAAITSVIMFAPADFYLPHAIHFTLRSSVPDIATTLLLFVPLGFLFPLTRRGEDTPLSTVVGAALAAGAGIQLLHGFQRDQVSSISEMFAAPVGAVAGAMLLEAVNRRIRLNARLAGRLSLEIPLVALVYLCVPLLIAASFGAIDDPHGLLALVPLGLFGARLIAAVQEFHFAPAGVFRNRTIGVVGGGWALLAAFPIALRYPLAAIVLAGLVGLATWYHAVRPAVHGLERRFEVDVLRHATPYLACYFLIAAVLPFAHGAGGARIAFGLVGSDVDSARALIRLLEPLTAFTVLGYTLAELRGRRELPFRHVVPRIAVECALIAVVIEACHAIQPGGASELQAIVSILAAGVGARIYHDQRERVRWILIRRKYAPINARAA